MPSPLICSVCQNDIPQSRRGWSTCSLECRRTFKKVARAKATVSTSNTVVIGDSAAASTTQICAPSPVPPPPPGPGRQRHYHLKRKFKMTQDDYLQMLAAQGNKCGICMAPAPDDKHWAVDHDHTCCRDPRKPTCGDCVRGILCQGCNKRLDTLLTDKNWLGAALEYLEQSGSTKTLGMTFASLQAMILSQPRSNPRKAQIRVRKTKTGEDRYSVALELWASGKRKVVSGGTYATRVEAEEVARNLENR